MLFNRSTGTTIFTDFPCLTLQGTPSVVPLPGLIYKIALERAVGDRILGYYKSSDRYQPHFLLTETTDYDKESANISPDSIKSLEKFGQRFSHDDATNPLYLCLIPAQSENISVGCVCKIVGVLTEERMVTVSFKALARSTIKTPLLNSGNSIWTSDILVCDDTALASNMRDEQKQQAVTDFFGLFQQLDDAIVSFKRKYKKSCRRGSSQHLLLLSPLSNTLFFQLDKSQFTKAWATISALINELKSQSNEQSPSSTMSQMSSLMDLTVAVLPTTPKQKVEFLKNQLMLDRVQLFRRMVEQFRQIFETLYSSTEYVQRYFSEASNLEKSRLIANQLKSLRFFIEDVKAQNRLLPVSNQVKKHQTQRSVLRSSSRSREEDNENDNNEDAGENDEDDEDEIEKLESFIKNLKKYGVHEDGIRTLRKDFKRFRRTNPQSAEYQVLRSYFDVICDIPFGRYSQCQNLDLEKARRKLDEDHYGLPLVKKRLVEYLCVRDLNTNAKSDGGLETQGKAPILLLVGPPGVGKTSIAKSIAEMLKLKFQRVSLGGVHNEAEIRGHRRTYVGSMCGLIINALRKSGSMNPLILLDEIDKVLSTTGSGSGYGNKINGDPGAALLEVLDPEQNCTFMDHYIGFPVDLSQVLFFCTANDLEGISRPLLDRMEVIEIPGYTPEEKVHIGTKFLLPKQIRLNGLSAHNKTFSLTSEAWDSLIQEYTRESGVRSLERRLASIVRGKILEYVEEGGNESPNETVSRRELFKYLGFPLHPLATELLSDIRMANKEGVVNGLSYNSDGTGSVLVFEVIRTGTVEHSKGPVIKATGNLGSVLQESIDIGRSLVKSMLHRRLIIGANLDAVKSFLASEYHLHVPMGAVSKDGPSAGTAITLALISLALGKAVDPLLCMTGEITLRGKILPVGGVKEKLLGAQTYGMKRVLIPIANRPDVVQAVTNDILAFVDDDGLHLELEMIKTKLGLSVTYVNDMFDVIQYVWPDLLLNAHFPATGNGNPCISKM
ncbi:hypothetical protein HG536_0E05610 [Torulaspora globosa]|uniref:Lon protease homolog 2, peroxisomal n=1 Tax=Torulaspora globosa TaxID=48254 RepID=A0A7G3ZJG4_9SACH|nr:uncharacterized protein HG536_0E05610 [Torulaspora globosa]QLL33650.1 hypothetical protein HG536_0E05610 [Torulaspora globosa]